MVSVKKWVGDEVRPIPLAFGEKKAFKRVASQITQVKVKTYGMEKTVTRRTVATDQDIIAMLSQLAKKWGISV